MEALKILTHLNRPSKIILQNRLTGCTKYINRMTRSTTDFKDIENLAKLKNDWWNNNKDSPVYLLHTFCPLRVQFVRDGLSNAGFKTQNSALPLEGIKLVDIGCGGGILSERFARIGAQVTGIDASEDLIEVAKEHAKLDPDISKRVNYIYTTVEEYNKKKVEQFDAIVASEVVEHVKDPGFFLNECVKLLKPGGSIFITTINKTVASWLQAILMAEYILNRIPRGTHQWSKFISPREVQRMLENCGCKTKLIHGIQPNLITKQWSWLSFTGVHYALHAIKQKETSAEIISPKSVPFFYCKTKLI